MRLLVVLMTWTYLSIGTLTAGAAGPASTMPFDHMDLRVSEPKTMLQWYVDHLSATLGTPPDRIAYGKSLLIVHAVSAQAPVHGDGSIDHIAFSVKNLTSKVKELEAAGAKT